MENLVNTSGHIFEVIIMNLAQNVCLDDFLGLVQNWVTWSQKLGHQARSKENLIDTIEVTFLK